MAVQVNTKYVISLQNTGNVYDMQVESGKRNAQRTGILYGR